MNLVFDEVDIFQFVSNRINFEIPPSGMWRLFPIRIPRLRAAILQASGLIFDKILNNRVLAE